MIPPSSELRVELSASIFGINATNTIKLAPLSPIKPGQAPIRTLKVKGDGNCFFRSVSVLMTGSQDHYIRFRDRITEHMATSFGDQLRGYAGQNDYLDNSNMKNDTEWATEAEILATSHLLGIDIALWTLNGMTMDHARHPAAGPGRMDILSDYCLVITHPNRDHYDPVLE